MIRDRIKKFLKENTFKIGFLIFSLIIAFSAFYYFTIYPRQQQQQTNNVDLQTKCDIQARKIFNSIQGKVSDINYTYKNHYSVSLS
ncbi:MAG: hypothetical protein NT094_05630, partial [Candidatus Staskawiczbacteria bacterium]|nr:hypothetical protein [Candidatus Staskawiczbacteria bacterium]